RVRGPLAADQRVARGALRGTTAAPADRGEPGGRTARARLHRRRRRGGGRAGFTGSGGGSPPARRRGALPREAIGARPGRGRARRALTSADPGDLDLGGRCGLDVLLALLLAPRRPSGIPVELVVERLLADPQRLRRPGLVLLQPHQGGEDVLLLDLAQRQPVGKLEVRAFAPARCQLA